MLFYLGEVAERSSVLASETFSAISQIPAEEPPDNSHKRNARIGLKRIGFMGLKLLRYFLFLNTKTTKKNNLEVIRSLLNHIKER